MIDVQSCFVTSLVELTPGSNILLPIGESVLSETAGQFFEGAEHYAERYTAHEHFLNYIRRTLHGVELRGDIRRILDIGSGAGNTVFPCLTLFPEASVVATDISPQLLAILMRSIETRPDWRERLTCVLLDACENHYREGAFDLVVGASILHHLLDPQAALRAARHALRPGGIAIFIEPFENGHAILRLAYEEILEKSTDRSLLPEVKDVLAAVARDLAVRTGSDKTGDLFLHLEDKWLFTHDYLAKAAEEAGFSSFSTRPSVVDDRIFTVQTEINLRLAAGLPPSALENWAWEILRRYDNHFSIELRRDLFFDAGIVLMR